jgi:hypothetical protein
LENFFERAWEKNEKSGRLNLAAEKVGVFFYQNTGLEKEAFLSKGSLKDFSLSTTLLVLGR